MSALKCSQADHQKQASRNCLQCWCPIRAHIVASGDGRHGVTTRSPSGDVAQKESIGASFLFSLAAFRLQLEIEDLR